jgi:hypothetical protein
MSMRHAAPIMSEGTMDSLDDVIADRVMELHASGLSASVRVQLGRPAPERDGLWVCTMRVEAPDHTVLRHATGADGFDALRVALQMIRQELVDEIPRRLGGEVRRGDATAETEFPNQFPLQRVL